MDLELDCAACGKPIGARHHVLDRRVEVVHFGGEVPTIHTLDLRAVAFFCDASCWLEHEPVVRAELRARRTFPSFAAVMPCARCGDGVDRSSAAVAYTIADEVFDAEAQPWLTVDQQSACRTYAVLCPRCESPDFEDGEGAEEDSTAGVVQPVAELVKA